MKAAPGYLTKTEAATQLGVTRRTVDRYVQKHDIPTFRFLGDPKVYIQEAHIQKLHSPIRKAN